MTHGDFAIYDISTPPLYYQIQYENIYHAAYERHYPCCFESKLPFHSCEAVVDENFEEVSQQTNNYAYNSSPYCAVGKEQEYEPEQEYVFIPV